MDRERRDRRAGSPSREARAALLGAIAQRRAEKNSLSNGTSATAIAHSTPLPDSDDSGSDKEEFSTPEGPKSSEDLRRTTLSVMVDKVSHGVDNLDTVMDSLGSLSLGGNSRFTSGNSSASGFQRLQKASDVPRKFPKEAPNQAAPRNLAGQASDPVELSSSDDDGDVVPRKVTKQNVKLVNSRINTVNYSLKPKSVPTYESDLDEESSTLVSKGGDKPDIVLDGGKKPYVLPGKIASILYQHQQEGIRWLWGLHLKKMGGILGDDMGLGKTMLMAAFFAGLFESKLLRTAIVVAPKTLIGHWVKELTSVGLSRKVYSFVDTSPRVRETALHRVLQMGGVLLTTYDMVRCNWKSLRGDFHGRDGYGDTSDDLTTWDYCVLDEGHLVKNPNTERAKSLRELPSAHRIIISGTPIQNNLKEMWALMDFCCPDLLGDSKEFKSKYESQIVAGNDKHASDREKRLGATVAQELRLKIAPFFLRRMKSEVFPEEAGSAEVPKLSRKNDLIVWLRLTARQEQLYRAFLESDAVVNALDGSKALTALAVMKKICDHPSLLTQRAAEDIAEGMEGMMGENTDRATVEALIDSLAGLVEEDDEREGTKGAVSCKMVFLFILMEKLLESGHRTLIFSQTRKMLNIIQAEIETRKWRYRRIDGTLKSSERESAVQDFQSRPDIPFFLLTSQVGGLGLTLTAADRVVIIDPAWNPSVDNQSVDRAYRIGQKKDVTVYRLMTCGTLEEKIYRKQVFKGGLMKIATENKNQMRYFSRQELHDLFRVPNTGFSVSVTQKQLSQEHFGEHRSSKELEEDIKYLEGLDMIAGVSHHDVLYSKAAPALPPPAKDEDDTNVSWEARNAAYAVKPSKPAPKPAETYTYDQTNALSGRTPVSGEIYDPAKHAWLRVSFLKDKIKRMAATLENEGTVSKLSDGGAKLIAKIKELNVEVEKLRLTAAPYMVRLASSSNVPKRADGSSSSNGTSQLPAPEQEAVGQTSITAGEAPVRVRSASGNNIYNTPRVGTDVRKSPVSAISAQTRTGNLEDALGALEV